MHNHQDKALPKKNNRLNHVWWLPIIAFFMVVYFTVNHFIDKGPLITIEFISAEGIRVKKTKVKYKDVIIGEVEKIKLSSHLSSVILSIRMNKSTESMLRKDTRFWVEKPRISINEISGLNTLLSGNFIAIEPGKNEQDSFDSQFIGLEKPPIILQNTAGLTITLLTEKASTVHPGAPIYFKGIQVGTVNRVYFSEKFASVKADIFINSPYDDLIKKQTQFWNTNGISFDLTNSGLDVTLESLEALVFGGISFSTPSQLEESEKAESGQEYVLYENKKATEHKKIENPRYFVSYFSDSVKGLSEGSPVRIKGMKIGEVKEIVLLFDNESVETKVPVLISIDESKLKLLSHKKGEKNTSPNNINIIESLVKKGLHTQMETDSLITGRKYITLIMPKKSDKTELKLIKDNYTNYLLIPSVEDEIDSLLTGVNDVLDKINKLPLDQVINNVSGLIGLAENKVSEIDIQSTLNQLNSALKSYEKLPNSVEKTLSSVNKTIIKLEKELVTVLHGLAPDAPLYHNLNQTVESLKDTLTSFKSLSDLLDSKPDALIFGKEEKGLIYE